MAASSAALGLITPVLTQRQRGEFEGHRRQVARRLRLAPAMPVDEGLDRAVLARVERDHRQPAARAQQRLGGGQPALELAHLVVHRHPQRLEGPGRRVARPLAPALGPGDHGGQGARGRQGCGGAGLDDGAGDRPRLRLVAQREQKPGQLGLAQLVDEVGGTRPAARHAHVQGPVDLEREAALALVELEGRDAEIEDDAVDRAHADRREGLAHLAEWGMEDREGGALGREQLARARRHRGRDRKRSPGMTRRRASARL